MAETVVNLAIEQLALIVQEVKLLGSARTAVESIKCELESIRPFLKEADARAAEEELQGKTSEGVQIWVQQVREQAYRIEDCIDEFTFTIARLPRRTCLVGILQKIYGSLKKLKLRHRIATDIQDIKSTLVEIDDRRKRCGLNFKDQGSTSWEPTNVTDQLAIGSYYMDEDQIVGHESTRKELYDRLVNGTVPQRRVIALVGAGGLGKTTLAANVYKNKDVKSHFNCHAWIHVGKTYKKEDLLRRIIKKLHSSTEESAPGNTEKSAPGNTETMDVMDLIDMLRKYLENKSYLVMFDDVWKDEFWEDVEHALPDNNKSSRLLVTTRNRGVADIIPTSIAEIHTLGALPLDHARQLFCRKTFNCDGVCPPELEELSNKIIEKCGGLPLAVVAVGGLLSKKNKIAIEWQKLLDNLGSELGSDPHLKGCNRVLSEGYNDLPHHLKPCLLYFGLFPESYSISCAKLIRLWIAEGFVQFKYGNNEELEEIGERYLTKLIQRNLVQVSKRDDNGRAQRSRVHDLMHEIILKKTEQMGFSRTLNEHHKTQCRTARRFAIHKSTTTDNVLEKIGDSKVRSIFHSNGVEPPEPFMNALFVANFKLMKVLDFEDAPIDHLPPGVGNLFHLHYLSLKNTKVKTLPKSIGKLLNLETLDLKRTLVSELPVEIKNLKKLRYLLVSPPHCPNLSYGEGTKFQEGLGSLMDLRKLCYVQVNSEAVQELKKLRQLRKLSICVVDGNGKELCPVIANMEDLKSLQIELMNEGQILDIGSMTSPPKYLERLYLRGNLKKLPDWIPKLQNLVRVGLVGSGLSGANDNDDPTKVLRSLPNLMRLFLVEAYNGEQVHIQRGWFPKLKMLFLFEWKGLKSITIEDGGMPLLETLLISATPLLKEIPSGVENLKHLTCLQFDDMLKEIGSNPKFATLERWEKLKHIPKFIVTSTGEGGERIVTLVQDIFDRHLR